MKKQNEVKSEAVVVAEALPTEVLARLAADSNAALEAQGMLTADTKAEAEAQVSRDAEREAMKASMPKAKDRKKQFSRFNQPVACRMCGKKSTWSEANGNSGLGLCQKCFDAATLENAHFDGHHQEAPSAVCPLCVGVQGASIGQKVEGMGHQKAAEVISTAIDTLVAEEKQAAEAKTTEVAKAAFAAALLKPKASKKAKSNARFDAHLERKRKRFEEAEASLKAEALKAITVEEQFVADVADGKVEVVLDPAPVAPAVDAEKEARLEAHAKELALKKLQAAPKLASKAAKAKAPVTPAKAKKAVEALVAKVVAEKAADGPLTLRLYAKGHFWFGKKQTALLQGLPYVKVAVDGKQVTLTPTKSAKDAVEVKFSHGSPQTGIGKLLGEWSKATQGLAITMVGDAIQVVVL